VGEQGIRVISICHVPCSPRLLFFPQRPVPWFTNPWFANPWRWVKVQCPSGIRRGSAVDRFLGLQVWIPPGEWVSVFCEWYVFLCDGSITRPEESYKLCWVIVCDLKTSRMRRNFPALGCCARETKITNKLYISSYCCVFSTRTVWDESLETYLKLTFIWCSTIW
jgi:hypothetical protein